MGNVFLCNWHDRLHIMIPKLGKWAKHMHERMGPQLGMLMWDAQNVGQQTASGNTVLASAGIGEVLGAADPRMAAEAYMSAHLSAAWAHRRDTGIRNERN